MLVDLLLVGTLDSSLDLWRGEDIFSDPESQNRIQRRRKFPTVLFPCSETSNFFLLRFALGPAVLESEFRADHESGLRIEQSPRGHYESSV